MSYTIRPIAAADTLGLRQAILRPHQTTEECVYPLDDDESSFHLGAFAEDQLVTIATVLYQVEPRFQQFETREQYRLRGMATQPKFQNQGYGRAVLQTCLERVWEMGGQLFWANARVSAAEYYQKQGFHAIDEEFTIPGIGPHRVMFLERPQLA